MGEGMKDAIVITGATGLVGRNLVASLRADGRGVRIVSRRREVEGFDAGVEVAPWDGVHLDADALRGAAALVHLAGEPVFGGLPTASRRQKILDSRVDSTEALVAAIAALPEDERPASFVCASAVGYYGSRGDIPLDESAAAGDGFLAEVCVAWERAAREAAAYGVPCQVRCQRERLQFLRSYTRSPALPHTSRAASPGRFPCNSCTTQRTFQRARSRHSHEAASALPCGVPGRFSRHHGHQS
jgi:NAD(P)-dependent dehydrogenase (short-subunit alcohol dehydrogenase family)